MLWGLFAVLCVEVTKVRIRKAPPKTVIVKPESVLFGPNSDFRKASLSDFARPVKRSDIVFGLRSKHTCRFSPLRHWPNDVQK